jgi:hypothetical protein
MAEELTVVAQVVVGGLFVAAIAIWGDFMLRDYFGRMKKRGIHVTQLNGAFFNKWKKVRIHRPSEYGMKASDFEITVGAERLNKIEGIELAKQHLRHRSYRKMWNLWIGINRSAKEYNKAARQTLRIIRRVIRLRIKEYYPILVEAKRYDADMNNWILFDELTTRVANVLREVILHDHGLSEWNVGSRESEYPYESRWTELSINDVIVIKTSDEESSDPKFFLKLLHSLFLVMRTFRAI